MHIGQQSISHGLNMYFKTLFFTNYYSGVEYELDSLGAFMSTWHIGYCIHGFLNFIVKEDVV